MCSYNNEQLRQDINLAMGGRVDGCVDGQTDGWAKRMDGIIIMDVWYEIEYMCFHRFVHGTCDGDADLATYNRKKESNPDYEYICPICKPRSQPAREMLPRRKDSK
jgi:hypothetical protein